MTVIIDRTEGDFAVVELESGKTVNVPRELFENIHEGKAYEIKECENPYKEKIKKLMDEVFQ